MRKVLHLAILLSVIASTATVAAQMPFYTDKSLSRDQLQGLAGGWYQIGGRFALTFALLGGSHIASPKIGGQVGFEADFPLHGRRTANHQRN